MDRCCIHYSSLKDNKLVALSSLESWKTFLEAAKKRNHAFILEIASKSPDNEIPKLQYHKACRSMFTLKRDLEKIELADEDAPKVRKLNRDETSQVGRVP